MHCNEIHGEEPGTGGVRIRVLVLWLGLGLILLLGLVLLLGLETLGGLPIVPTRSLDATVNYVN